MRKGSLLLIILILVSTFSVSFAAPENVASATRSFDIDGQKKSVNLVTIDLNSPDMELEVVTAHDRVIGAESFQSMIDRKGPVAAINANFFDAYNTLVPYGSIMKNKKLTYLEGINTSFLIKDKNKVDMDLFSTRIKGYLDGNKENKWNAKTNSMDFFIFEAWYVNNPPTDSSGVYIFTPERGDSISLNSGTVIVVEENKIVKVVKSPGVINIPKNGYLIYYAKDIANDNYINNRFKIGRTVEVEYITSVADYENENEDKSTTEINLNNADYMISAGPYLVKNGQIIVDAKKQGFKEDKITINRGQRSALGITKDNKLILVTGSNLNMNELAKIMIELKCDKAMNLDGGASSALYANGKMLTPAGRNLNTVLMVFDRKK